MITIPYLDRVPVIGSTASHISGIVLSPISTIANTGMSLFQSALTLPISLANAAGKAANGVANTIDSPFFSYILIGGLGLGVLYLAKK